VNSLFVTGTDTEVGKSLVAAALLRLLARQGLAAVGMKPVAAGCDGAGCNEDVAALMAASSVAAPAALVCPWLFPEAVAPHLAAAAAGRPIRFAPILGAFAQLGRMADAVVVEGVGGFRVPLGPDGDTADLAQALALPVVLVVGLRLGCINHALLTAEAVAARGLTLAGWVANRVDPAMARADENIETLRELLPAPLLGVVPRLPFADADAAADCLQLPLASVK